MEAEALAVGEADLAAEKKEVALAAAIVESAEVVSAVVEGVASVYRLWPASL